MSWWIPLDDFLTIWSWAKSYFYYICFVVVQVETKLRETAKRLEKQLGEEQAARLEAEKRANEAQKRSSDEIKKLRENLEKAEKETKELQKKLGKCINLWLRYLYFFEVSDKGFTYIWFYHETLGVL